MTGTSGECLAFGRPRRRVAGPNHAATCARGPDPCDSPHRLPGQRQDNRAVLSARPAFVRQHRRRDQRVRRDQPRPRPGPKNQRGHHRAAGRLPLLHGARRPAGRVARPLPAPEARHGSTLRARRGRDHRAGRPGAHPAHADAGSLDRRRLSPRRRRHHGGLREWSRDARRTRRVGEAGGRGRPAAADEDRPRRAGLRRRPPHAPASTQPEAPPCVSWRTAG